VILFLIAYNSLSDTISKHKNLNFTAFADDYNIIVDLKKQKNPTINLNSLFEDISNWCNLSGASLSLSKCKHIHICRKHNCVCQLSTVTNSICTVAELTMLGLSFDTKYKWQPHINKLAKSLTNSINIIKCLSNDKYNCQPLTLVQIVRCLCLSKIDYGLPFYGLAPKSQIKPIQTLLNNAIRSALGAFCSTPVINLHLESNIPPLDIRTNHLQAKMSNTITQSSDTPLKSIIDKITKKHTLKYRNSVLHKTIMSCASLGLPISPAKILPKSKPPWHLQSDAIDTHLSQYKNPVGSEPCWY